MTASSPADPPVALSVRRWHAPVPSTRTRLQERVAPWRAVDPRPSAACPSEACASATGRSTLAMGDDLRTSLRVSRETPSARRCAGLPCGLRPGALRWAMRRPGLAGRSSPRPAVAHQHRVDVEPFLLARPDRCSERTRQSPCVSGGTSPAANLRVTLNSRPRHTGASFVPGQPSFVALVARCPVGRRATADGFESCLDRTAPCTCDRAVSRAVCTRSLPVEALPVG